MNRNRSSTTNSSFQRPGDGGSTTFQLHAVAVECEREELRF